MYFRKVLPQAEAEPIGNLGTCVVNEVDKEWETRASDCTFLRKEEEDTSASSTMKPGAVIAAAAVALIMSVL
jgi:hypothetical protein